ncbi:MAG: hypothetical protein ABI036_13145 [Fibrobacteria bacterium]
MEMKKDPTDSNTIILEWEGPFPRETITNEFTDDFGIYQIYGPHEIYCSKKRKCSDKVLLYIGRTAGSSFSGRLKKHGFCDSSDFEIYVGSIKKPTDKGSIETWKNMISDIEKVLINKYAPSYNANMTSDLRSNQLKSMHLRIINDGKCMDLDKMILAEDVVYKFPKN